MTDNNKEALQEIKNTGFDIEEIITNIRNQELENKGKGGTYTIKEG